MDDKTRAENLALREMFQTDGWRVLMRNTQGHLDNFRSGFPFNVENEQQLYFCRGMMASLTTLLNMEAQLDAAEALKAEDDDADSA
jgi:hypothetical protein